jgi:hypothetical protein
MLCYPKPDLRDSENAIVGATPGFPVKFVGAGEPHAAFLNESRTRGGFLARRAGNPGRPVVFGPGTLGRTWAPVLFLRTLL